MLEGKDGLRVPETFAEFIQEKAAIRELVRITMPRSDEVESMSVEEAVVTYCKKIGLRDLDAGEHSFVKSGRDRQTPRSFVESNDVANFEVLPVC
jgi:hypothetical protein